MCGWQSCSGSTAQNSTFLVIYLYGLTTVHIAQQYAPCWNYWSVYCQWYWSLSENTEILPSHTTSLLSPRDLCSHIHDVMCYKPIPIIYRTSLLQNSLKVIIMVPVFPCYQHSTTLYSFHHDTAYCHYGCKKKVTHEKMLAEFVADNLSDASDIFSDSGSKSDD